MAHILTAAIYVYCITLFLKKNSNNNNNNNVVWSLLCPKWYHSNGTKMQNNMKQPVNGYFGIYLQ